MFYFVKSFTTRKFTKLPPFTLCSLYLPGKTATHAIVYAQLHTPDGTCHGMNAFCVPIRDPQTYSPFPGVIVGDLGEKLALNGLDNGFGKACKLTRTSFFISLRVICHNLIEKLFHPQSTQ